MKSKKQPFFLLLTAIFFLAAGIITFTFFNPSKKQEQPKTITDYKEPTPLPNRFKSIQSIKDTKDWESYSIDNTFTIKYPKDIVIDQRQTVKGLRTAFIFKEDSEKKLPRNVPTLFIANTGKKNIDGLTVYKYSDCKKPCDASSINSQWIKINDDIMGIKNPRKQDIINYYLTDKNMQNSVINIYLGNTFDATDGLTQKKIHQLEEIATTITLQ